METTNIYYGLIHNLKGVKGENKTFAPFIMFIKGGIYMDNMEIKFGRILNPTLNEFTKIRLEKVKSKIPELIKEFNRKDIEYQQYMLSKVEDLEQKYYLNLYDLMENNLTHAIDEIAKQYQSEGVHTINTLKNSIKREHLPNTLDDYRKEIYKDEIVYRILDKQREKWILEGVNLVILDTETTSLKNPRPVQKAGIVLNPYFKIINSFNFYIKQNNIHPEAMAIHKITPDFLNEYGITELQALIEFKKYVKPNDIIIAHNSKFDETVLRNYFLMLQEDVFDNLKFLDTLAYFIYFLEGKSHRLDSLWGEYEKADKVMGEVLKGYPDVFRVNQYSDSVTKEIHNDDISHNAYFDCVKLLVLLMDSKSPFIFGGI